MFFRHDYLDHRRIRHGFFGRAGGVSEGIYESLNCGLGSGDDPAAVRENRGRACAKLGVDPGGLLGLWQIHSDICVLAEHPWNDESRPQADAMVTDRPGISLSVLTADCAPVLFAGHKDDGSPVIGAAHAGWGGALKGVLEATYLAMMKLGADGASIKAVIGPCIGPQSYEVGEGFREPFITHYTGADQFFHKAAHKGHLMFDLPGYVKRRLEIMGVRHVHDVARDTYTEEQGYFSYRRATHREEGDYGRQISMICIESE